MTAAPFDYDDLVATADELLQEFGRQVTFIQTATTAADPDKPWRGSDTTAAVTKPNVWAALVPWVSADDKDSVRYDVQMAIVSASSFPESNGELFDQLIDSDGSVYHLHDADIVAPGTVRVLYTFRAEK